MLDGALDKRVHLRRHHLLIALVIGGDDDGIDTACVFGHHQKEWG